MTSWLADGKIFKLFYSVVTVHHETTTRNLEARVEYSTALGVRHSLASQLHHSQATKSFSVVSLPIHPPPLHNVLFFKENALCSVTIGPSRFVAFVSTDIQQSMYCGGIVEISYLFVVFYCGAGKTINLSL